MEEGASRGDVGLRQVQRDALFLAQRPLRLVQPRLRLADPAGVGLARPARGLLRPALHGAREDAGETGVLEVAGGVARPAVGALAGLLHLPLLPLQLLLGVADVLLGDLLLGADGLLVGGEVPAVQAQFAAAQFGDALHAVEQLPVVADQQQAAVVVGEYVVESAPGVRVEVVGGLVEQEHVGPLQQLGGEPEGDDLTAAERAQPPVQGEAAQAQAVELGAGALLDVPVVADGREVLLGHVPGLDRVDGPDHGVDTEDLGHGEAARQGERLRQVAEDAGDRHGARGGPQLPGDQLEQGGLAGPVGGDETRTARAHGEREVLEDGGVVGPGEGQVGTAKDGVGHGDDLVAVRGGRQGSAREGRTGRRGRRRGHCDGARKRPLRPAGTGSHPEMSSSPTMSATPRCTINVFTSVTAVIQPPGPLLPVQWPPFAFVGAPLEREDREVRSMTVLDAVLRGARIRLAVSLASRAAA